MAQPRLPPTSNGRESARVLYRYDRAMDAPKHSANPHRSDSVAGGPNVQGFELGPFETNCYVVTPATSGPGTAAEPAPCWVIDPGFEPSEVLDYIKFEHLRPVAVILTHAHLDHIAGLAELLRAFPRIPVLIHEAEKSWPGDPMLNLSGSYGFPVYAPNPTGTVKHGDVLTLAGDSWSVLHTPGHSPGGITLYHEPSRQAIVGDTLFAGSIGRSDFPGSDHDRLVESIQSRLYTLPADTKVYPGHGPRTTIGRESQSNPFVRA